MDEELERRIGRNEALFREVNEAIARGLWPGEEQSPVRFRCECARIDCNGTIELNAVTYSGVRAHPRRFMVLVGHQLAEVEDVVERREGYVVVEKRDEAGAVARALDPPG